MANETGVSMTMINDAVTRLKNLVPDKMVQDFQSLDTFRREAGPPGMDAAQWLEDVVLDRIHGMGEHVKNLKFVFNGLADTLSKVATALQTTDSDGALAINGPATAAINEWVAGVNGATFPPAVPKDHFANGKTTYESGDTTNPNGLYTSFDVSGVDGGAVLVGGNVVYHVPPDIANMPAGQAVWDEYKDIFVDVDDIADNVAYDKQLHPEGWLFVDPNQVVTPSDPEN